LVVAGASWFGSGAVEAEAASAAPDSVVFLGRVSDDEREYLLRTARGLAYVSLFEGFGLPPVEAMARGTPVLASATTAIPEVVGDAGVLVDPTDVGAIAEGLRRILTDDQLRSDLSRRGLIRAKNFEVERTGARAVAALRAAATS
jgi:glycosyltransferase involved in cell wall biosynthesis